MPVYDNTVCQSKGLNFDTCERICQGVLARLQYTSDAPTTHAVTNECINIFSNLNNKHTFG